MAVYDRMHFIEVYSELSVRRLLVRSKRSLRGSSGLSFYATQYRSQYHSQCTARHKCGGSCGTAQSEPSTELKVELEQYFRDGNINNVRNWNDINKNVAHMETSFVPHFTWSCAVFTSR